MYICEEKKNPKTIINQLNKHVCQNGGGGRKPKMELRNEKSES